jgi:hypothetical protein
MFDGAAIGADDASAARDFCREAGFEEVEFSAPVMKGETPVIGDLLCSGPLSGPE